MAAGAGPKGAGGARCKLTLGQLRELEAGPRRLGLEGPVLGARVHDPWTGAAGNARYRRQPSSDVRGQGVPAGPPPQDVSQVLPPLPSSIELTGVR